MMDSHSQVDLSILIVSYDTVDLLRDCLASIRRHPPACSHEILVVDNGSPDGSAAMVRDRFPAVRCIELDDNVGFARGNNLALREARGRRLLLLNSDTRVLAGSLDGLMRAMDRNPDAGAVGCRQLDAAGRLQLTWGRFPTFQREIVRKALHWRLRIAGSQVREYLDRRYAATSPVDWVSGSCLLVRREAIELAGLLDENIFLYFEDIDWCRRIQGRGFRILYEPGVAIIHHGGASAARHLIDALVAYRRSQLYFCRKYYGPAAVLVLRGLVAAVAALSFARHSFAWLAAVGRPRRRFSAYCSLLALKKIFGTLLAPVPAPERPSPTVRAVREPRGLGVREAI